MNKNELRRKKLESTLDTKEWRIIKSYLKKIWKYKFPTLFSIIIIVCIFKLFHYGGSEYDARKCGEIIDMKQVPTESGSINNILYIRYDESKQSIHNETVGNTTYYGAKIGGRVYFKNKTKYSKSKSNTYGLILFFTCLTAIIRFGVICYIEENKKYGH